MGGLGRQLGAMAALTALALSGCGRSGDYKPKGFEAGPTIGLFKALSADELAGRAPGTPGSLAAQDMITTRMAKLGLEPLAEGYLHPFMYGDFAASDGQASMTKPGVNVIGRVPGTAGVNAPVLLITAHYDHLGERDGEIYNGADDNASGTAAMLAMAEYFKANPPVHDVLFVAFDAEEDGFGGSREFVRSPPVSLDSIGFVINLDMVSRSDTNTLWASGTSHRPFLVEMVEVVATKAPVTLNMGFDTPEAPMDWTMMSDHGVFHRAGIAYIYLGVEDHPDYHTPKDDFERVPVDFYLAAIDTAILLAAEADRRLVQISEANRALGPIEAR